MSRRGAGIGLIAIAALLYAARHVTAALFIPPNLGTYDEETFTRWLGYVGDGPGVLSAIALLVGVSYLVLAEWEEFRGRRPAGGDARAREVRDGS